MKFRCERDRLVEALGAAGRAVANRGGSLPVLSGVRAELTGNQLKLTGSDLELTLETRICVPPGGGSLWRRGGPPRPRGVFGFSPPPPPPR